MAVAALAVRFMNARLCIGHLPAGESAATHNIMGCRPGHTACDKSGLTRCGAAVRRGGAFTRLGSRISRQPTCAAEREIRHAANRSPETRDQTLLALT